LTGIHPHCVYLSGACMTKPTVLIWVEAGRGLGHFRVVSRLTRSLIECGCKVFLATCRPDSLSFFGVSTEYILPLPRTQWLPGSVPASNNGTTRKDELIRAINITCPDALVLEMWPLRRSAFDDEIVPAIERFRSLRPNGLVFSLLRDLGEAPSETSVKRLSLAAMLAARFIDLLLIRGDGQIQLTETWPEASSVAHRIRYVGYFGPEVDRRGIARSKDWVFGMGGGWFEGIDELCELASKCHADHSSRPSLLRVYLPGGGTCTSRPGSAFFVDTNEAEYLSRLASSELAILQAGYNSVVEAIFLGVSAIFFPAMNQLVAGEQRYRMERFVELGIVGKGRQQFISDVTLTSLHFAVERCLDSAEESSSIRCGGETNAAKIITNLMEAK
jgi:predicted glycosyltransferase